MQQSNYAAESGAQVRDIKENVQKKASEMAGDAKDRAVEYYSEARIWLRHNYGKVLAVAGGLAAIGLITYAVVKRRRSEDLEM
jgi:hypothetical protein